MATLLRHFDVRLVGLPAFPQADEGRPVLGIMSIKEGNDFKVELQPRVEFSGNQRAPSSGIKSV